MEMRKLGQTDLDVSVICLGTMTWGEQNTEQEGHEQIDYALDQGVNFLDTAELYAVPTRAETYGRTEEIIGSWLTKNPGKREDVIIASKVAGPGLPWIRGGEARLDPKNILAAIEGSLSRLKTDYIDLYQLHWPNRATYRFGQRYIDYNKHDAATEEDNMLEVLRTLDDLVGAGKIRHIGLSNEMAWGTMKYLQLAERHNLPRVVSSQNEYSLLNRAFEEGLGEVAAMEKVGLLAWSPLACGALSGKYAGGALPQGTRRTLLSEPSHRDNRIADQATDAYVSLARQEGLDPCQMALAFVRQQAFTTAVIIGATNMDQLRSNIASKDLVLNPEMMQKINAIHEEFPRPF